MKYLEIRNNQPVYVSYFCCPECLDVRTVNVTFIQYLAVCCFCDNKIKNLPYISIQEKETIELLKKYVKL
jgi:transcription elongation factor Elf1